MEAVASGRHSKGGAAYWQKYFFIFLITKLLPPCQILKTKMHQIRFRLGLRPQTPLGEFSTPPDLLAAFKGTTGEGRGKKGEGRAGKERERRGGRGRRSVSCLRAPQTYRYANVLVVSVCVCLSVCQRDIIHVTPKPLEIGLSSGNFQDIIISIIHHQPLTRSCINFVSS